MPLPRKFLRRRDNQAGAEEMIFANGHDMLQCMVEKGFVEHCCLNFGRPTYCTTPASSIPPNNALTRS